MTSSLQFLVLVIKYHMKLAHLLYKFKLSVIEISLICEHFVNKILLLF